MRWFVLFFALWIGLDGKILECARFQEVREHVEQDTLLLLDIDDTLIVPRQMLGSDEWFSHRLKVYRDKGLADHEALDKSLAEWEAVRHLTNMEIVEEGIDQVIRELQEKNFSLMGLTTQGIVLNTRTAKHLIEHKINLASTAPVSCDHYFEHCGQGVLFRNGILSTSGRNKGECLFRFCDAIGWAPKKIVFINDKQSHLAEVEKEAQKRGVPFVGLRYGYSDARKQAFRADVADFQFAQSTLGKILSDDEAMAKMVLVDKGKSIP